LKYKIGIFGSNIKESEQALHSAQQLGNALAEHNVIVVTGACSGMPYIVARAAREKGAEIWGFSPACNEQEQIRAYPEDDFTIYSKLFYVPQNYKQIFFQENLPPAQDWSARLKYRNVVSTTNVDAGIHIAGGWGSLNEFTNLIYDGKTIGVLVGSGGLADQLPEWSTKLRKKSESQILFQSNPAKLVTAILAELQKKDSQQQ
jgi:predicted Rossmann-fold nucleotide-binding protein